MDKTIGSPAEELIDWLRKYAQINLRKNSFFLKNTDFIREAARRGLFGMQIPTNYGGTSFSLSDTLRVIEQLAAIDISLAAAIVLQHTCSSSILKFSNLDCQKKYLPKMANGELTGSFALTELSAGSNPRAMATNITQIAKGKWCLNGSKAWIGNASSAGIFIVFAKHLNCTYKGISCFIIPSNTLGITIGQAEKMLGVQENDLRNIIFKDVVVSEENLLGKYGKGMQIANTALMCSRLFASALSLGTMKRSAQIMLNYASWRKISTGLLLENPVTLSRLSWLNSAITAVSFLNNALANDLDAHKEIPEGMLLASKIAGSEFAWQAADNMVQLLGARGLDESQGASKLLRDTRFLRIGEGPTETLLMELGAALSIKDSQIHDFLEKRFGCGHISSRLNSVVDEIQSLPQIQEDLIKQSEWTYFLLGKLGVFAFLEASLYHRCASMPNSKVDEAIDWVKWQFEHQVTTIKNSLVNSTKSAELKTITEEIKSYEKDIGLLPHFVYQEKEPLYQNKNFCRSEPHFTVKTNLYPDFISQAPEQLIHETVLEDSIYEKLKNFIATVDYELEQVLFSVFSILIARLSQQTEVELLLYDVKNEITSAINITLNEATTFGNFLEQFHSRSIQFKKTWATPCEAKADLCKSNYFTPNKENTLINGVTLCFSFGAMPKMEFLNGIDCGLILYEKNMKPSFMWVYRAIFCRRTVARYAENFKALIISIITSSASIDMLNIIAKEERDRIFTISGLLEKREAPKTTIIELFENNVKDAPHNIALLTPQGIVTYAALAEKVNLLAHYFNLAGIRPGEIVAFFMGRTPCFIASLLAILKLGATILTLNIRHPQDRNQQILKTCSTKVLLIERELFFNLPATDLNVICVDDIYDSLEEQNWDGFERRETPESLAYIVFTSGSTGKPKGVMVSHRAICDQLIARRDTFNIQADARILYAAVPNFDIAIWEYFGAFVAGGAVILSGDNTFTWDPKEAIELIQRYKITHMQISPTQLNLLLLSNPSKEACASLKYVYSGGELMPKQVQQKFSQIFSAELIHIYGSTEAVLDVTYWSCKPENILPITHIGQVLPHKKVYILDEYLQLTPIGVPGDIYIGGELAEGYLGQPELTKDSFISDPFAENISARMYRTGDKARCLENGSFEFLGRTDQQIKINGFRIEPGEIETILESYPGVKQLRVVARKNEKNKYNDILVAYYVKDDLETFSEKNLRQFASQKLPKEMVPALFIKLDVLPLTITDKLDVRALSTLDNREIAIPVKIAEDSITQAIMQVWEELLSTEVTDEKDDFFELGGHSLSAIQLIIRIREIFSTEITVRDFFNNPSVHGLAELIKEKQRHHRNSNLRLPIAKISEKVSTLAGPEENLWYLQQLNPKLSAYNCAEAIYLKGPLNLYALELAINNIIVRHESLRTTFRTYNGKPERIISPKIKFSLSVVNLDSSVKPNINECVTKKMNMAAAKPFTFDGSSLLFNIVLFNMSNNEYVLFLNFHHIIVDGSSINLFIRELSEFYSAIIESREALLPEINIQPVDYIIWREKQISNTELNQQKVFWRNKLEGVPTEVDISLGYNRLEISSDHGARIFLDISKDLLLSLRDFSKRKNFTLFEMLMTAFSTLIKIVSQENDFTVGTVVAGRKHSAIENTIGNFASTVVLRQNVQEDDSLDELLSKLRNQMIEILDNNDITFEEIVSLVRPNRKIDQNPLFNVFMSLYNANFYEMEMSGIEKNNINLDSGVSKFDLSLVLFESEKSLNGYFEFKTDVVHYDIVKRLSTYYTRVLKILLENSAARLSEIELVDHEEKNLLVNVWNNCYANYPKEKCLHELFEEQVSRVPDKIAIIFNNNILTYAELNQKANKLARHLRQVGVQTEHLVGLCIKPSVEMIIGLMGIVKAGAAYVPIDPEIPIQRICYIAQAIKATIILTEHKLIDRLENCNTKNICLDKDWPMIERQLGGNLNISVTSQNLIYMIFTSGSTGQPKGVKTLHYNVAALLCNTNYMVCDDSDIFAKINNFAFDISTWEIWTPLICGAHLIGVPEEIKLSPSKFVAFIDKHKINMLYLPTALFHSISTEIPSAFKTLKLLIVGGEALDPNKAKSVLANNPPREFVNAYGPTEVTCNAAWYDIHQLSPNAIRVPIGRPISNTQFYILNSKQKVLPLGAKGELYIGGAGVSRGYLDNEITKKVFLKNIFIKNTAYTRLYKTGDVVRYLSDGNIEFLGRQDNQVKIRGFRIEIGEIETAIRKIDYIRSAIVLIRKDSVGDNHLVAFIELYKNDFLSPTYMLRNALKDLLPNYMIPSVIMVLDKLPVNTNGKIDRASLNKIEISLENDYDQKIYPRNEVELRLSQIWEDIIGLNQFTVNKNFFDSGGDSLKAIQLISAIKKEFSKQLPLEFLYENGTIELLAVWLKSNNISHPGSTLLPLYREGKQLPLFLVHPLSGSAMCYHSLAQTLKYPLFGFQSISLEANISPIDKVEEMAAVYIQDLLKIQPCGPFLLGGWSFGGIVAFEMARQLESLGHIVHSIILFDSAPPGEIQKTLNTKNILKLCLEEMAEQFGIKTILNLNNFKTTDSKALLAKVLHQLKSCGAYAPNTDIGALERLVAVCLANTRAVEKYTPLGGVNCDIILFRAEDHARLQEMLINPNLTDEISLGWAGMTNKDITVIKSKGHHMSFLFPPNLENLVPKLRKYLVSFSDIKGVNINSITTIAAG